MQLRVSVASRKRPFPLDRRFNAGLVALTCSTNPRTVSPPAVGGAGGPRLPVTLPARKRPFPWDGGFNAGLVAPTRSTKPRIIPPPAVGGAGGPRLPVTMPARERPCPGGSVLFLPAAGISNARHSPLLMDIRVCFNGVN